MLWRRQWHPTPVLLPGKSHGWRSLVGCSPWGHKESDMTEWLHFSLSCIGEGNGNPFQCSCLENPRDGRAWWAAVYGVAQSRTRLKWLSIASVYSCHLVLTASVRSIPFLSFIVPTHLCMKSSLGISNFLEEISGLSHSTVFLCLFAMFAEEGFLISRCYSLEFCIQMGLFSLFSFAFNFSSFLSYL